MTFAFPDFRNWIAHLTPKCHQRQYLNAIATLVMEHPNPSLDDLVEHVKQLMGRRDMKKMTCVYGNLKNHQAIMEVPFSNELQPIVGHRRIGKETKPLIQQPDN